MVAAFQTALEPTTNPQKGASVLGNVSCTGERVACIQNVVMGGEEREKDIHTAISSQAPTPNQLCVVGERSWKRNAVQTPSIPIQAVLEYENISGLNLEDIAGNVCFTLFFWHMVPFKTLTIHENFTYGKILSFLSPKTGPFKTVKGYFGNPKQLFFLETVCHK